MTQAQLAEPYSAAFVSQIEAGRKLPSEAALRLFAKKLGIAVAELATGVASSVEAEINHRLRDGWQALYVGRYREARTAFRTAERISREFPEPDPLVNAVVGQAWCSERQGGVDDALRLFARAHQVARERLPAPAAVEAVAGIARCHQMRGETSIALYLLERYLAELEQEGLCDPIAMMRTYASLVWPYMELGLYEKAYDVAARALRLQTRVERPEEIASMHLNVARALLSKGDVGSAVESLEKATVIYRDLNWQTEIARAQLSQGILLLTQERTAEAREQLVRALETFRRVGFVREEARCLNELARAARAAGDLANAESSARQALELLREMIAVPEQALAHRELGLCLLGSKPREAEAHLREAIALYERCGEVDHAADTYRVLGDLVTHRDAAAGSDAYRAGLLLIGGKLGRDN